MTTEIEAFWRDRLMNEILEPTMLTFPRVNGYFVVFRNSIMLAQSKPNLRKGYNWIKRWMATKVNQTLIFMLFESKAVRKNVRKALLEKLLCQNAIKNVVTLALPHEELILQRVGFFEIACQCEKDKQLLEKITQAYVTKEIP